MRASIYSGTLTTIYWTATGTWEYKTITKTSIGTSMDIRVATNAKTSTTFYVDNLSLKTTNNTIPINDKTITFTINGTPIGTATTNAVGVATITYKINLNTGTYPINATFAGDEIYATSTGTNNLTVIETPTTITVESQTGYQGDKINLTATLTDTIHSNPELLTPNQQTGTETLGNTNGFIASGATINSSTEQPHTGTRSLKVTTNNNTGNEGFRTTTTTVKDATSYTAGFWVYAPTGTLMRASIYSGTLTTIYWTATGTWEYKTITKTSIGTSMDIRIATNTQSATTFYTDDLSLKTTNNTIPISGKTIQFSVDGNPVGTATTNTNGIATLEYTITPNAGTYPINATFAGDEIYATSTGTNNLTVIETEN